MHARFAVHLATLAACQAAALCLAIPASNAADPGPPFHDCASRRIPYRMESMSMVPALLPGGTALLECFDHAIRGSAILPDQITIGTLRPGIEAGDLVAFRPPRMIENTWMKRVVGLPGDSVEIRAGTLVINGTTVATEPSGSYKAPAGVPTSWPLLRETLANGRSYLILADQPRGSGASMDVVTVPPGNLFVLGDNRPNSMDSRFQSKFGFVPLANLIARVSVVEAAAAPAAVALTQPWPSEPARAP